MRTAQADQDRATTPDRVEMQALQPDHTRSPRIGGNLGLSSNDDNNRKNGNEGYATTDLDPSNNMLPSSSSVNATEILFDARQEYRNKYEDDRDEDDDVYNDQQNFTRRRSASDAHQSLLLDSSALSLSHRQQLQQSLHQPSPVVSSPFMKFSADRKRKQKEYFRAAAVNLIFIVSWYVYFCSIRLPLSFGVLTIHMCLYDFHQVPIFYTDFCI